MRILKIAAKIFIGFLLTLVILAIGFATYVYHISDIPDPKTYTSPLQDTTIQYDGNHASIGNNHLSKNKFGIYELYTEGPALERGMANGLLTKQLMYEQEKAFTDQIKTMIPSEKYLKFLKYVVGFMNRDLSNYINQEYKEEIFGISQSCSDTFNWIGTHYSRQLNYHGAHDIGHTLQNLMLVGCTSFAAWGDKSEDGSMILGRNFDFYMGDDFAKNKIVSFVNPDQGYKFAFVTWAGFIGVVSGMNEKGLTVTINAAKSDIPWGAATPVSLVAREILQYAENIEQAVAISQLKNMFVSESFLIGSAQDKKSVIIEKTPKELAVYEEQNNSIICTNHYQSALFAGQKQNREQIEKSASVYRYNRTKELLNESYPLNTEKAAKILRDYKGINYTNIGVGNEKAINQMIAHHSIIFKPEQLQFWVSTSPWQLGTFVHYDLHDVFNLSGKSSTQIQNIPEDIFISTQEFENFQEYLELKQEIKKGKEVDPKAIINANPNYYDAYRIAGDICSKKEEYLSAVNYYQQALQFEIATINEKERIMSKIKEIQKKMGSN